MRDPRKLWNTVASYYDVIWEVADYSSVLQSIVKGADIHLGMRVIDVAARTGIVGFEAARKVGQDGDILCIDYCRPMLERSDPFLFICMKVLIESFKLSDYRASFFY